MLNYTDGKYLCMQKMFPSHASGKFKHSPGESYQNSLHPPVINTIELFLFYYLSLWLELFSLEIEDFLI